MSRAPAAVIPDEPSCRGHARSTGRRTGIVAETSLPFSLEDRRARPCPLTCAFASSEYRRRLSDGVQVLVPRGVGVRVSPLAQRLWDGWKSSGLSEYLSSGCVILEPVLEYRTAFVTTRRRGADQQRNPAPTLARSGRCNRWGTRSRGIERHERLPQLEIAAQDRQRAVWVASWVATSTPHRCSALAEV
jgi:hypothetical protein